ncbi:MAG: anthranilate synthase component I [Dehalococcoidales bacterium]|nr:anthranilate synthase component I [Dehalococcoidales bacterium]
MYSLTLEEVRKYGEKGVSVPVYTEIVADLDTPVSVFMKINRNGNSFLLESVEGGQSLARYSFIGTDPYKIISTSGKEKTDPLPLLAAELKQKQVLPVKDLPRFYGGAVGYLSYESVTRFEDLPSPERDPLALPESMFLFVDTILIFDHVTHKIKIVSQVHPNGDIEQSYREATNRIDDLARRLKQPLPASQPQTGNRPHYNHELSFVSNFSKEKYEESVQKIKEYIAAGEAIQVVLAQRLASPIHTTPFEIYRALRTINPSPYMFYFDFKSFQIIGASPEMLVRVEDGIVTTRPLAGTRPRGNTPEEDARLEKELRADEKERAEHIMLVDLGRNDIGRVSEPGTVKVSDLMEVERYSHVMHLVTNVEGKLRQDLSSFDALRACFPAGTVSGAPKIRAMEIIAEFEPEKRGPYAGAAGYFSHSGNMDMAISIRTMVVKNKTVYVQAGGGIVYDSVPELEFRETLNKARSSLQAIEQAENSLAEG